VFGLVVGHLSRGRGHFRHLELFAGGRDLRLAVCNIVATVPSHSMCGTLAATADAPVGAGQLADSAASTALCPPSIPMIIPASASSCAAEAKTCLPRDHPRTHRR
jgi:hypothetical protein